MHTEAVQHPAALHHHPALHHPALCWPEVPLIITLYLFVHLACHDAPTCVIECERKHNLNLINQIVGYLSHIRLVNFKVTIKCPKIHNRCGLSFNPVENEASKGLNCPTFNTTVCRWLHREWACSQTPPSWNANMAVVVGELEREGWICTCGLSLILWWSNLGMRRGNMYHCAPEERRYTK